MFEPIYQEMLAKIITKIVAQIFYSTVYHRNDNFRKKGRSRLSLMHITWEKQQNYFKIQVKNYWRNMLTILIEIIKIRWTWKDLLYSRFSYIQLRKIQFLIVSRIFFYFLIVSRIKKKTLSTIRQEIATKSFFSNFQKKNIV